MNKNLSFKNAWCGAACIALLLGFGAASQAADDAQLLEASMQALNHEDAADAGCADCPERSEDEDEIKLVAPADSLLETAGKDRSGPEFNGREEDSQDGQQGLISTIPMIQPASDPSAAASPAPASPSVVPAAGSLVGG